MVNESVFFNKAALKLCRDTLRTCRGLIDDYAGVVAILIHVLPAVDDQRLAEGKQAHRELASRMPQVQENIAVMRKTVDQQLTELRALQRRIALGP